MASYDQEVSINLNVNKQGVAPALTSVAGEVESVQQSLEGLDTDFDSVADSMSNFADVGGEDITPELNVGQLSEEIDELERLGGALDKVDTLKQEVAESNEVLNERNQDTAEGTQKEAKSFGALIDQADTLQGVKDAVADSNAVLDNEARNTREGLLLEKFAANDLEESIDDMGGATEILLDKQKELSQQEKDTAAAANIETRSFEEMMEEADSLSQAKHAVANANEKVQNESGKSTQELLKESEAIDETRLNMDKFADSNDGLSDRTRSVTKSIRRMRDATDDSSNAMRAAAEVGDLFEDGLGSLSVNLGAFTVALRNFLTQVPLLLTGLGALGAAATGAASAVATLGGALAGLVGVGALVYAQEIKEEFSQIEDLGQAMQVVMSNLFDTFLRAIEPLTQLNNITSFFTETVEGLATGVNMLSATIAELTRGSEELRNIASEANTEFLSIQDAFDAIDGSTFQEIINALATSWALLGEEVMAGLSAVGSAIADAIVRSSRLLSQVEGLGEGVSDFSDTLSQLAEVGFKIGGGLLPVFNAFSDIVASAAETLNQLDSEQAQTIVTALALFAATSKVSSTLASIVTVIPSIVTGFTQVAAQAASATSAFNAFQLSVSGSMNKIGAFLNNIGILGGLGELGQAIIGVDQSFKEIAFSSSAATAKFQYLALNSEITAKELQELAIQGRLTQSQMDALAEETGELDEGLRNTQLQAMLTEEQLEELGDVDIDPDGGEAISAERFTPDFDGGAGGMFSSLFGGSEEAANEAKENISGIFGSGGAAIPGMQGLQAKSSSAFKTFEDDSAALQVVKNRISGVGDRFRGLMPSVDGATSALGGMKTRVLGVAKTIATTMVNALAGFVLYLGTAISGIYNFIIASWAEKKAILSSAAAKYLGAAANLALAAAEYIASSGALALAASLAIATGGIAVLITAIGALAVGVLANFDSIKKSAAGVFGFIKEAATIVGDFLLTYFIEAWNLIAHAVKAFMAGISPLTDMVKDFAASLGLMGGKGKESAGFLDMLSNAADKAKNFVKAAADRMSGLISILGKVLFIVSSVARVLIEGFVAGLKMGYSNLKLVIGVLDTLLGKLTGTESGFKAIARIITQAFGVVASVVSEVPGMIEDMLNNVIDRINDFAENTRFLDKMDNVDFSAEGTGTSRAEVEAGAADASSAMDSLFSGSGNTINMEETDQTTINQSIDANPEDKAQLSRITKDAIEEANTRARRTQGTQ